MLYARLNGRDGKMNTFTVYLQDATRPQQIEGVTSFVGEDSSGSFGIQANHDRMITSLIIGMARFRIGEDKWHYLAVPGALLYFHDNALYLTTRHYLIADDYEKVSAALQQQLLVEEEQLHETKASLHRMEEEVLKRLWKGRLSNG